ncbi:MAG TPA: DUF4126 family protein [Acidisarcina sp.]
MSLSVILLFALSIGLVCGLRSMMGPALVCIGTHVEWMHLDHSKLAFLHSMVALAVFSLFAVGEIIGDKMPWIPGRNQPGPLIVRFVSGAICGAALCITAGVSVGAGALLGGIGGVAGGLGGYYARRSLTTKRSLPDLAIGITEDVAAIGFGLLIVSRFEPFARSVEQYINLK